MKGGNMNEETLGRVTYTPGGELQSAKEIEALKAQKAALLAAAKAAAALSPVSSEAKWGIVLSLLHQAIAKAEGDK